MEALLGGFLVIEGGLSIAFSQDQRAISNIGRGVRMMIGIWLIRESPSYRRVIAENGYRRTKRITGRKK